MNMAADVAVVRSSPARVIITPLLRIVNRYSIGDYHSVQPTARDNVKSG